MNGWSDALPTIELPNRDVAMSLPDPVDRILFVEDGTPVGAPIGFEDESAVADPPRRWDRTHAFLGDALESPLHVRRDRYWEPVHIFGAGGYLALSANTSATISSTYTSGTTTTETEAFGSNVSVSGGLEIGPLRANVSKTFSEAYSTSVSIMTSTSETFERSVVGVDGKTTRFMILAAH